MQNPEKKPSGNPLSDSCRDGKGALKSNITSRSTPNILQFLHYIISHHICICIYYFKVVLDDCVCVCVCTYICIIYIYVSFPWRRGCWDTGLEILQVREALVLAPRIPSLVSTILRHVISCITSVMYFTKEYKTE